MNSQLATKKLSRLPGYFQHIGLLWRLRMAMTNNAVSHWGRYSQILSLFVVMAVSISLGGFAYWFMSHPSINSEPVVSQFYLNLLCFVTAMLWILWPILSAGVEDGSERDRFLQYPISETRLLSASIISGVFKPVGFLMFAPLIGASFGYLKNLDANHQLIAIILLVSFIAMCATWSQAGVYWLRDVLRSKSNGQALTLTLLAFIVIGLLLPQVDISWLYQKGGGIGGDTNNDDLAEFANIAHAFSKVPPGYLGEGLLALRENRFDGFLLETGGMLALALIGLFQAKRRLQQSNFKSAGTQAIQHHKWLIFTSNRGASVALAQREAFELWRNPRFRLLTVVPFFLIVVLHLVSANELITHFFGDSARFWLMSGMGFYASVLILLTFTHNTFAYDDRGLLNLMNAPLSANQLINAKARIHSLVSLAIGISASFFYSFYVIKEIYESWILLTVLGNIIIVPIVTTIGLWVSVHYPIKFDASLNRKERQPILVSLAGFAGCLVGAVPSIIGYQLFLNTKNIVLAISLLGAFALLAWLFHLWSLVYLSKVYDRRQASILAAITRV